MFAVFYFVALYFTIVKEFESDEAGIGLIYYTPGLGCKYVFTVLPMHHLTADQAVL
jgi:hypothetical protein